MTKKARFPQSRHHIFIFDEDWDYLTRRFGPGSEHSAVGISGAIKEIIHKKVMGLRLLEAQAIDQSRVPAGAEGLCQRCLGDPGVCSQTRLAGECPSEQ